MVYKFGDMIEYHTQVRWSILVVVLALVVLGARLFFIQVVEGERLETLARISHVVRERVPAYRGTIRDRNGEVLAVDVDVADLMVVPRYVKDVAEELRILQDLGIIGEAEAERLRSRIEEAKKTSEGFQLLLARPNLSGTLCPFDQNKMTFDPSRGLLVCTTCGRQFPDQRAMVQSRLHDLPGFSLRTRTVRHYPARELTAHAVGFVGEVSPSEVERSEGRLRPGDWIGRAGIEKALDAVLRGTPGENVFVRGAGGERLDPASLPPPFSELQSYPAVNGKDVTLTIDLALQSVARDAMAPYRSGAVVMMDVETGEVLVLYSHPSFDPEPPVLRPNPEKQETTNEIFSPMLNKTVTAYAPGSVMKMITAVAALSQGVADAKTKVFCGGSMDYKGRIYKCHKRSGHGEIGIVEALAASCDIFFYTIGDMLGLDNIAHYARDYFGLGEYTGIEISERRGLVPTMRWYAKKGRGQFMPGFTLNVAVGQGDLHVTPLAIARAYAALVNGGRLLRPYLVRSVKDQVTGLETTTSPKVVRYLDLPPTVVELVMSGLHGAVNSESGTAFASRIEALPFAGKTGTAQAAETRPDADEKISAWLKEDHAWFVGYAPSSRPRIVVVVFVEHGGFGGQVAAPVARKLIEAYYSEHAEDFADLWRDFDGEPVLEIIREVR